MAENAPANGDGGNATPATPTTPAGAGTQGTDPTKTAPGTKGFDPSTITDEDFSKIFEDPRLFTHDRFKALNESAKEAKALKADREKAENAQLEQEKKFQELSQKHEQSANDWKGKFEQSQINNKITVEASKLGITDVEAATKLLDRQSISIDDDGNVSGVEEAVKALAESKSYLVDKSKQVPTIGSPTNPSPGNQPTNGATRQFKASEIMDPKFYQEHGKEIDASLKAGIPILDDRNNQV
jgi:hypothetical protein